MGNSKILGYICTAPLGITLIPQSKPWVPSLNIRWQTFYNNYFCNFSKLLHILALSTQRRMKRLTMNDKTSVEAGDFQPSFSLSSPGITTNNWLCFFCFFKDRVSWRPVWIQTCYIVEGDLKFLIILLRPPGTAIIGIIGRQPHHGFMGTVVNQGLIHARQVHYKLYAQSLHPTGWSILHVFLLGSSHISPFHSNL